MPTNESLSEMLDKSFEDKKVSEIVKQSPAVLQGLTDERAALIKQALGAETIEELATNKYVLWAQALLTIAKAEK